MCSARRPFRRHQPCCHAVDHKSGVTAVSVCTIHLWQMCQLAEHSRGNCYGAGRGGGERGGARARERGESAAATGATTGNMLNHQGQGSCVVLEERTKGCCVVAPPVLGEMSIKHSPSLSQPRKLQTMNTDDAIKMSHKVVSLLPQWREEDSWRCSRPGRGCSSPSTTPAADAAQDQGKGWALGPWWDNLSLLL